MMATRTARMTIDESPPFPNSYWVLPGRLLAGEYPTLLDTDANRHRVGRLLDVGITAFLDLTESDEVVDLEAYLPVAQALASAPGALEYTRIAIPDMHAPSVTEMCRALDTIDTALGRGRGVYVHCWGGIGRTGTVVGCYLVRHGMTSAAAIAELAHLRRYTPDVRYPAPAHDAQRQMVLQWQRGH